MENLPKKLYRLNKKIKDDTFNVDYIARYNLSLQINFSLFRFCVTDTESNRCLLLEDYQFESISRPEQLIEQLELIYDDHHVLQAGFWRSIRLAVKNINFSLVPFSLFDEEYLKEYLNVNCMVHPEQREDIFYYKQQSTEAVNIFSADKDVIGWFINRYPQKTLKVVHHTSPLIEGIMSSGSQERALFIHVENNFLTILVKKNKMLEFCNSFHFFSPEDFVYFTMFVFDQLELNPETTPVVLWGEINHDSPLYKQLYKYIRHVTFGNKPSSLYFGYHFDEIFDHRFFDLYSMHLCE